VGGATSDQALCTNVATGTKMTVWHVNEDGTATSDQGFSVHINY
jgi:hypothetical protein